MAARDRDDRGPGRFLTGVVLMYVDTSEPGPRLPPVDGFQADALVW